MDCMYQQYLQANKWRSAMDNYNNINQMNEQKTAAEHEFIILHYLQTGQLDRDDAIKKFIDFNSSHPDYCKTVNAAAAVSGNLCPIGNLPNGVIVENLNTQLFYLTGKNLLNNNSHT